MTMPIKDLSRLETSAIITLIGLILLNLMTLQYILNQSNAHYESHNQRDESHQRDQSPMVDSPPASDTSATQYQHHKMADDLKIPRIVHLSWKNEKIPDDTVKWVKRWSETNPNYQVWFWTDKSAENFIATKYPKLLEIYKRYKTSIFKADAMRYIILYEYGGIWADLDVEPLKSLDPVRELYPSILSQESEVHARAGWHVPVMICNAFMATRKKHPFFKFLLDMLEMNQKDTHPVAATGPIMLTRMHKAYEPLYETLGSTKPWNKVHIAPINMFLPTTDVLAMNNLRKKCEEKNADVRDLCDKYLSPDFKNGPTEESFTDHHWWHSWFGNHKYRTYHSIQTVLPNVVFPEEAGKF